MDSIQNQVVVADISFRLKFDSQLTLLSTI
jgi:hypothetical protein